MFWPLPIQPWHLFSDIFCSKDFESRSTLQLLVTSFEQPSKTLFAKSLWSHQVKVDNLSFTIPVPSASETWVSVEWSLVCLTVSIFVNWRQNPWMFFSFPFSTNQHDILTINIFQYSRNDPRLSWSSKILRLHVELGPAARVGEY